jgi:ABC-type polysaccharide/polyol phosphate export permease
MWRNLAQLVQYRPLIHSLVVRDLKARYRGSVLGLFWSFFNPLLLLTIYSFVFSTILKNTRDPDTDPFALFLFCGLLPWTWFATGLNECAVSLIHSGNLIKKVLFPAEVLPIVSVLANMVHFLLPLPLVLFLIVIFHRTPDLAGLAWLPAVVLVQLVFTTGLALVLAALTVHFRDIRDILANVLMLWFFSTPIIYWYGQDEVKGYETFFDVNPFTHLAISYQEILFFPGPFGHWLWLVALGVASAGTFLAGFWLFDRLRDSFAEVV